MVGGALASLNHKSLSGGFEVLLTEFLLGVSSSDLFLTPLKVVAPRNE